MELLASLTPAESDRLWWRLVRALAAVSDEIDCLSLAPPELRDKLYGPNCLDSYECLLADLADLADSDLDHPRSIWTVLVDNTPEEGNPQWHDSAVTHPTSRPPKWRSLTRLSPVSSRGRNLTARLRSSLSESWSRFWTR